MTKRITASILIIGNEVLSGGVQDVNVKFIASRLTLIGIDLTEVRIIPDIKDVIIFSVNELRKKNNYLFTTGGIGPTHDDITAESVAEAFKVKLVRNEIALKTIEEHHLSIGIRLNSSREKMAYIPETASLIINDISKAPGFRIENVFVLAGFPDIVTSMFKYVEESIETSDPILSKTLKVSKGESFFAQELGNIQSSFKSVDIGSYPIYKKGNEVTDIVFRGKSSQQIEKAIKELKLTLDQKNIKYDF